MLMLTLFAHTSQGNTNKTEESNCVDCHQAQTQHWQTSDHAKAMAIATSKNVLGNFNNQTLSHYTQQATFYTKEQKYWVEIKHENTAQHYQITYVFGHYPLQQYLITTTQGKLQVLPYSWDSRKVVDGGQRWYANYDKEDIKANDRLHWLQPLQTWNGMCADCHSSGLTRNYNEENDTFDTQWQTINVSCQSCHGEISTSHQQKKQQKQIQLNANWLIKAGDKTATWQGEKRDNRFMDNCFACHSLRAPLTDGFKANKGFLNQFSPSLLMPNMYHADGQIKEEVYVYGSFLQSKMFAAGVNCLDCHNAHSMKVKVSGNVLCTQCHNAEIFDQKSHHQHAVDNEGSQCVNCHMPENTYMGVDDRRDHSFKIPKPHLSNELKTPNACIQCHEKQNNEWAAKNIEKWHGKPAQRSFNEKNYHALQQNIAISLSQHIAIINDEMLPVIQRATAIVLLGNTTSQLSNQQITTWVKSSEPLIRFAIARVGNLLPIKERATLFSELLNDEYKAIRVEAANHLLATPTINKQLLTSAFNELQMSHHTNSWRGEGRLNQSLVNLTTGNISKAMAQLKAAINIDPYFDASYINLADIYRQLNKPEQEKITYTQGLKNLPQSDLLHYSYGMHNVRNKKLTLAIKSFVKAMKLQPNNSQYIYIYLLALDSNNQTKKALAQLKLLQKKFKKNRQLIELGINFSQKLHDQQAYQYFYTLYQALH